MQVKKDEKRRAIIEATMRICVEKGLERLSTSEIAKRAKVGKGTIYVYFRSKSELIKEVAKELYFSFVSDVEEAMRVSKGAKTFVEEMVERIFRDMRFRGRLLYILHKFLKEDRSSYEEFQKSYKEVLRKAYEKFRDQFKVSFDEVYFYVTSFFMSSYIMAADHEPETAKHITLKALKQLLV